MKLPHGHGIDLPHHVRAHPKLKALRDKLAMHFLKRDPRHSESGAPARAEARAQARIEDLLDARLAEHAGHRASTVGKAMDRVAELQGEVVEGMLGVLGDKSAKTLKPGALATGLKNLRDELRGMRKWVTDRAGKGPSPEADAELARLLDEVKGTSKPKKVALPSGAMEARLVDADFKHMGGGRYRKKYTSGFVEIWVNESGLLEVHSARKGQAAQRFGEFDVMTAPYRDKPLSSRVVQAHHGCQSSLMERLFKKKYDAGEAPTIWLRDSTGDSPHGRITHERQNLLEAERTKGPLTYEKIRNWAIEDLLAVGAPKDKIARYLQAMDAHVKNAILGGKSAPALIGNVEGF